MLGLVALLVVGATAARAAAVPFHLRVPRLADAVPGPSLPLLLAWTPLPLAVAALAALGRHVLPLAIPLDGERAVLVVLVLLTLAGTAVAAWLHDDLRHAAAYLVLADAAVALLGLAWLDAAAWGPVRAWLVILAVSKTALGGWVVAIETRFRTRRLDDLRGWARRAPLLAAAFVLVALATVGIPGWATWAARSGIAGLAGGQPLAGLLWVAGALTLPAYARILWRGAGRPLSRVEAAPGERPVGRAALGAADPGGPRSRAASWRRTSRRSPRSSWSRSRSSPCWRPRGSAT